MKWIVEELQEEEHRHDHGDHCAHQQCLNDRALAAVRDEK